MLIELATMISVVSGIAFVGFFIGWIVNRYKELILISFLFLILFISFISWIISASNLPWIVEDEKCYKVVTTTYDNGNKIQTIYINDVARTSSLFGSVIIPDGKYVKKITYKKYYNGIYYEKLPKYVIVDEP